jgi:hypothetical protein
LTGRVAPNVERLAKGDGILRVQRGAQSGVSRHLVGRVEKARTQAAIGFEHG